MTSRSHRKFYSDLSDKFRDLPDEAIILVENDLDDGFGSLADFYLPQGNRLSVKPQPTDQMKRRSRRSSQRR